MDVEDKNTVVFQSTPSSRRATGAGLRARKTFRRFQSTPSSRRATTGVLHYYWDSGISIHALLTEGDK